MRDHVLILGDDLLDHQSGPDPPRDRDEGGDALLLKVNQIGTLTEAAEALRLARDGRLGGGGQRALRRNRGRLADRSGDRLGRRPIESRLVTRSERLAKWNRLLTVADDTRLDPRPVAKVNIRCIYCPEVVPDLPVRSSGSRLI